MAQHFPTAVGATAIAAAYDKTFEMITLAVSFEIIEVVETGEGWAFARTASKGTVKFHGQGEGKESEERNQELFVLRKEEGKWGIERYCFCSTLPSH